MRKESFELSKYFERIKDYYRKASKLGVWTYVLSDIFQKGMVFAGGFVIVRILTKEDYGNYTYILNIFSIFTLLGDFGISAAVLQYASVNYSNEEKKKMYIGYGERVLGIVSLLSVIIIFLVSLFYEFTITNARNLFRILFLLPFFNNERLYFQSILRVELRNKEYARINILSTAIHYIALIGLAYYMGLNGAIVAAYPEALVVLMIYILTAKPGNYRGNNKLSFQEKKAFWKYAFLMQINQTSLALLNYLDIYCLGITVKESAVIAEYKVASTIPTALYFVPKSIMFFMVPIMGRRKNDFSWMKSVFKKIVLANVLLCSGIAIVFAMFAEVILKFVYGTQYIKAIPSFLILLIGFSVYGILQTPSSNILSIQERLNAVLFVSVAGAVLNIVLNICLINAIGSAGAAIATVSSHLFIGGILTFYLFIYLKRKEKDIECKDDKGRNS